MYRKILIIGHIGCGKSTILNKVAEELKDMTIIVGNQIIMAEVIRQGIQEAFERKGWTV